MVIKKLYPKHCDGALKSRKAAGPACTRLGPARGVRVSQVVLMCNVFVSRAQRSEATGRAAGARYGKTAGT